MPRKSVVMFLCRAVDLDAGEGRQNIFRTAFEHLQEPILGKHKHTGEVGGGVSLPDARQQERKIVARKRVARFARVKTRNTMFSVIVILPQVKDVFPKAR